MIYAGIGSRQTPRPILEFMTKVSYTFAIKGLTLRSGNARGADYAFYSGAMSGNGKMEIFLPAPNFGVVKGQPSDIFISDIPQKAFTIAEKFHPNWNALTEFGKRLMARNVLQVYGLDLQSPVDFIICYTSDGEASGGTGQAIRIAMSEGIEVFNIHRKEDFFAIKDML